MGTAEELAEYPAGAAVYNFKLQTDNRKLAGDPTIWTTTRIYPVASTMSDRESCPESCPLRDAECYAGLGRLALLWRKMHTFRTALNAEGYLEKLSQLPLGWLCRLNQAGDIRGPAEIAAIAVRVTHARVWLYTHRKDHATLRAVLSANRATAANGGMGLVGNVSADDMTEADRLAAEGHLVAVTVPPTGERSRRTPAGREVKQCPAQYVPGFGCGACGNGRPWCQRVDRSFDIGFEPEGARARKLGHRLTVVQ